MKYLAMMNGWKDAPQHWWRYLLLPFRWERTPAWVSVSMFGFVFFFDWTGE